MRAAARRHGGAGGGGGDERPVRALNKSKDESDFVVVQQPSLSEFGKDDSLFGSCYGKDLASCEVNSEDEKGGKNRSKSESLMGTLKNETVNLRFCVYIWPQNTSSEDKTDFFFLFLKAIFHKSLKIILSRVQKLSQIFVV